MLPPATSVCASRIALLCLAGSWALPLAAHDFWIEPANFRPVTGTKLPVTLLVGEDFTGTSQPFIPEWFVDFSLTSPAGRQAITGLVGDDPAATLALAAPGLHVIGYHSTRSFVDLDPKTFNRYLRAEGLDRIQALREARGESDANGREYYSRCAKSLVRVGDGPRTGFDRVLGYPLELIPRVDPSALKPGDAFPVLLHYLGKPLAGVLVIAFTADAPGDRLELRTGADGLVTLPLDRAGIWLIKAVHMISLPASNPAADWESFWASLTFETGQE